MDVKNIEYKQIFVTLSNPERSKKMVRIPFPCYAREAYYAKDVDQLKELLDDAKRREQKHFKTIHNLARNFLSNSVTVQILQCEEFLAKLRMFESTVKTWKEYLAEKVALETVISEMDSDNTTDNYFIDESEPTVVDNTGGNDSNITDPPEGEGQTQNGGETNGNENEGSGAGNGDGDADTGDNGTDSEGGDTGDTGDETSGSGDGSDSSSGDGSNTGTGDDDPTSNVNQGGEADEGSSEDGSEDGSERDMAP